LVARCCAYRSRAVSVSSSSVSMGDVSAEGHPELQAAQKRKDTTDLWGTG
jgi:hypothetical protein